MFKKVICVVLIVCISFSLFALDFSKAKLYSEDEFPEFAVKLRRAEIIFFGGIPLAYPIVNTVLNSTGYETGFRPALAISCSVSAVIAVVDYVIGLLGN